MRDPTSLKGQDVILGFLTVHDLGSLKLGALIDHGEDWNLVVTGLQPKDICLNALVELANHL